MARALVPGSFVSTTLQVLSEKINSRPVLDFLRGRKFLDSPLKKLEIQLLAIYPVLNDAEKEITNPSVKKWLDELKDVVYDAEELVDQITTEALRFKLEVEGDTSRDQVCDIRSTSDSIDAMMQIKIKEIVDRLEYISKEKDALRLKQIVEWKPLQRLQSSSLVEESGVFGKSRVIGKIFESIMPITEKVDQSEYISKEKYAPRLKQIVESKQIVELKPLQRLQSISLVEESGVYGRDQDKKKILEMLSLDDESADEIIVITILGVGGVGKTTLAQLVYNDSKLQDRFDLKAWVSVSEDFNVERITKAILEGVTCSSYNINDLNFLQLELKERLAAKKCLLVLDDIWNENYNDWDVLQRPLRYAAKGSKIIVTTRLNNVASIMEIGRAHHLETLSDKDCPFVFARHAFGKKNSSKNQEILKLCKRIVATIDAIETNLKDKTELDKPLLQCGPQSKIWSSSQDDDRRDERIEEEAVNLLHPPEKLKELTIRGYRGKRFPTWIRDHSWDNLTFLSLEYCERCTVLPPLGKLPSLKVLRIKGLKEVESMGLEFYGEDWSNPFLSLESLHLEDMLEWKHWFTHGIDDHVKAHPRLRELFIVTCPKLVGSLPNHLTSLKNLVVRGCQSLTLTVSSLPNLSDLEINDCHELVQSSGANLSSLKHMILHNILRVTCPSKVLIQGITGLLDLKIFSCEELVSLWPKDGGLLKQLTLLRHLEIRNCPQFTSLADQQEQRVPSGCRLESLDLIRCEKLDNLQGLHSLKFLKELSILSCPRLASFPERSLPAQLKQLKVEKCTSLKSIGEAISWHSCNNTSLEYLYVCGCDSLVSIARSPPLSSLKKLEILRCHNLHSLLDGDEASSSPMTMKMHESNNSRRSVLEVLTVMECPSLTSLSLYRAELPPTLKHLQISYCSKLESVGESWYNLKPLESMEIAECESCKTLPEGLHNLNRLSVLRISGCPRIVCFPEGGFPTNNLRKLEISNCDKLLALPSGLGNFTSLEELIISNCQGITSFPQEAFPTTLTSLVIGDLKICKPLSEWGLERITSLRSLSISGGYPDMVIFPPEEEEMAVPPSLIKLTIRNFPKLENLSAKMFQDLSCLEELCIWDCPQLRTEDILHHSHLKLCIIRCTSPEREWLKISHISGVFINGRSICDQEEELD